MLMRAPLLLSALQLATSGHFLGAPLPLTRSVLSEAQEIAQVPTTSQVEVLAPGLVIIRNALSEEEQKLLASSTETLGRRAGRGFRNRNGDLNADAGRGRIYDKASQLPRCFRRLCSKVVSQAMTLDSAMPSCAPSHVLINHYTTTKGLLWHRDIYANDGDGDHPIVNLSVGASCDFGVEVGIFGRLKTVRLRSGDALLFGGPCRYVKHAVKKVLLDETPEWMSAQQQAYRLSLTFREAPSVLGQEDKFRTFDIGKRWFAQTQKAWRPGQPLVAC